jgi:hypothetical protein
MLGPHGQSAGGCVRVVRGRALSRGPDGTWFDGRKWAVSVIEHSNILWCDGSNDKGNVRLCLSSHIFQSFLLSLCCSSL